MKTTMMRDEYRRGMNIFDIYMKFFPTGTKVLEKEFNKADKNHNGFIQMNELESLIDIKHKEPFFKKFEVYKIASTTTGHGCGAYLYYDEEAVKEAAKTIMKKYDKNKDKKLSLKEFKELQKEIAICYEKKQDKNFNIQTRIDFVDKVIQITKEYLENVKLNDVKNDHDVFDEENFQESDVVLGGGPRNTLRYLSIIYLYYNYPEKGGDELDEMLANDDLCFGFMEKLIPCMNECKKVLETFK